jgi:tryptophan synthase beta chain
MRSVPEDIAPPADAEQAGMAGMYGDFGGRFAPDALTPVLDDLEAGWLKLVREERYWVDLAQHTRELGGRPTSLHPAEGLTARVRASSPADRGAEIWLKREDAAAALGPGAPVIAGMAMLTRFLRRPKVFVTSQSPSHAIGVASIAALFNLPCDIAVNPGEAESVAEAAFAGARIVETEITDEAEAWAEIAPGAVWIPQRAIGPHPIPTIVRDLRSMTGRELRAQCLRWIGRQPAAVIGSVTDGRECLGLFAPFVGDAAVSLDVVCDAATLDGLGQEPLVMAGARTATRLGPIHAGLAASGRVRYHAVEERDAVEAALHAAYDDGVLGGVGMGAVVALAMAAARALPRDAAVIACVPPNVAGPLTRAAERLGIDAPKPRTEGTTEPRGKRKRRKSKPGQSGADEENIPSGANDHDEDVS